MVDYPVTKNIKVLFLWPQIGSKGKWHQGIASLATYLRSNGYRADLIEIPGMDLDVIEEQVREYGADVIAATANSHQFPHMIKILKHLRSKFPRIYIVLGGVHVTIAKESIQTLHGIDAVCRGEGEDPLLQIVDSLENGREPKDIPNITFLGDKGVVNTTTCGYLVDNLDRLPIAHRDLFSIYRKADRAVPLPFVVRFLFCRGCPYDCTYCCNRTIKETYPDKSAYVRWPSTDKAIEELCLVSDQYNFKEFVIDDDVFTLKKKWTMDFCNKYPDRFRASKSFRVNIRIGTVDEEMLRALKDAGCTHVDFGLESGDEEIRRKVLSRKISNEMILDTAAMAQKVGIQFQTFNIVGIPGEGRREIFRTIRLNQKIKPDRIQVTVFYPYPNTPLGEYCINNGMVVGEVDSYFGNTILKHDKLSKLEIELAARLFKVMIYSTYSLKNFLRECVQLFRPLPVIGRLISFLSSFAR